METTQIHLNSVDDMDKLAPLAAFAPDLLIVFGAVAYFESPHLAEALNQVAPTTAVIGCSTAGEIAIDRVYDHSCIISAVKFTHTQVKTVTTAIADMTDSFAAGARLGRELSPNQLTAVLLLGTGVAINGSALVAGLESTLPKGTNISGGLAGDAGAFQQTWTLGPAGSSDKHIVAVGFYGDKIQLSYGTNAGWEPFGPTRKVTRCDGNVLYELDDNSALQVYKRYLGEYAKDLPSSGLLFPFAMLNSEHEKQGIFRTILAIDESQGSLTLAGDIDPNGYLELMQASTDKLINGAEAAAQTALQNHCSPPDNSLAILVSCVGRKLIMGDRIDEEVEVVADTLGEKARIIGYYSNGEIARTEFHDGCRLHNQTMTITWISENS